MARASVGGKVSKGGEEVGMRGLTCNIVDVNKMLQVLERKVLVFGEQLHATLKDLECSRVPVAVVLNESRSYVDIAGDLASLPGVGKDLATPAQRLVDTSMALDPAHGAHKVDPDRRDDLAQAQHLGLTPLLELVDLLVFCALGGGGFAVVVVIVVVAASRRGGLVLRELFLELFDVLLLLCLHLGVVRVQSVEEVVVRFPHELALPHRGRLAVLEGSGHLQALGVPERQECALGVGLESLLKELHSLTVQIALETELGGLEPHLGPEAERHQGLLVGIEDAGSERHRVLLGKNHGILLLPFDPPLPKRDLVVPVVVAVVARGRREAREGLAAEATSQVVELNEACPGRHKSRRSLLQELLCRHLVEPVFKLVILPPHGLDADNRLRNRLLVHLS